MLLNLLNVLDLSTLTFFLAQATEATELGRGFLVIGAGIGAGLASLGAGIVFYGVMAGA